MMALEVPLLAVAYGADLLFGDPPWFPHPVRGMGWAIHWGERVLRNVLPWERLAGVLLVGLVVGASYLGSRWMLQVVAARSASWGFVASAVLLCTCLSTRDLAVESRGVHQALVAGDLSRAQRQVSRIVGRDTERLEQPEIIRATLETIAESTLDGILSPLFYFFIGGVPLAVAYKAVNTLDSMIGHRSARYIRFGWGAATLDTWANWLPARWSAAVFAIAAKLCGYSMRATWRCAWRDGGEGTVPNAGIPEAALAGALGVQLGGTNWYQGRPVAMAPMGLARRSLEPQRIQEAVRLMYVCSVVACAMTLAACGWTRW